MEMATDSPAPDTSGFYALGPDGSTLLWGPNGVAGPGFALLRACKYEYAYPVQGWVWCDSREDAARHFGVAA